ncbi:hypothetical protein V6N13_123542 [Hibiscus sabdariffa]
MKGGRPHWLDQRLSEFQEAARVGAGILRGADGREVRVVSDVCAVQFGWDFRFSASLVSKACCSEWDFACEILRSLSRDDLLNAPAQASSFNFQAWPRYNPNVYPGMFPNLVEPNLMSLEQTI